MRLLFVAVMCGSVSIYGCKRGPTCEDAIEKAAKRVASMAAPDLKALAIAECTRDQWSDEMRSCIVEASTQSELIACSRLDPVGQKRVVASKIDTARATVKKYAFEAFPSWSAAHPDKDCPERLADLNEYMHGSGTDDPWGQPYRMMCGPNLPAGAKGIAILSLGEDGKEATADDIKSWE
jgi:hypothetical protein